MGKYLTSGLWPARCDTSELGTLAELELMARSFCWLLPSLPPYKGE